MSTPAQTVGPFLHIGLSWLGGEFVVPHGTPGSIWIHGVLLDGSAEPVRDGLIETWQADPDGRFDHPDDPRGAVEGFRGFGRSATTVDGHFAVLTLLPGALPGCAPHINVSVFARGLLHRVVTRIYFPQFDNASDPVFESVPEARRRTLVAKSTEDGYRFDIRLQGDEETVFFDV
ncbi:protocatechuate 3,4-dioxygenase subunit alpha [Allokutzneria sp. A3M-2-11 16]|uniref:protocatechuate 3,4-dioxygenase subunit alpha n=1 Tax=Allokutzneria sp. A3M-2-11 16 TaxID=2962043 RepID=UPI0020B76412|nr:protocatechuate 3,4-dioxygenase subunit alpha [Allokutzneria sp. A3M-2-11 16]MCP3801407.1 protocatechuate 3,4-dioxygenase subunit alpha [Allokutzneria sp. A3M-2-11 16]